MSYKERKNNCEAQKTDNEEVNIIREQKQDTQQQHELTRLLKTFIYNAQSENVQEYDINNPTVVRHKGRPPKRLKSSVETASSQGRRVLKDSVRVNIMDDNIAMEEDGIKGRKCLKCKQHRHYAKTYQNIYDIIEMDISFNCYILTPSSDDDSETFPVDIYRDNKNKRYFQSNKAKITLANFKVSHLKEHICNIYDIKKVDQRKVKFWRVNVKAERIENNNISTKDEIVHKLEGQKMRDNDLFNEYFKVELANQIVMENIHIITIIPTIVIPATVSPSQQGISQGTLSFFRN
ncbi:17237_t:CDS:2 [Funneliformis geosporum]|nr:17237_t:CDS:2 [Funneliformis geosporum]